MWRGFSDDDFARPKWGIYRSIVETGSLRGDEEQVRFADFVIKKGVLTKQPKEWMKNTYKKALNNLIAKGFFITR